MKVVLGASDSTGIGGGRARAKHRSHPFPHYFPPVGKIRGARGEKGVKRFGRFEEKKWKGQTGTAKWALRVCLTKVMLSPAKRGGLRRHNPQQDARKRKTSSSSAKNVLEKTGNTGKKEVRRTTEEKKAVTLASHRPLRGGVWGWNGKRKAENQAQVTARGGAEEQNNRYLENKRNTPEILGGAKNCTQ